MTLLLAVALLFAALALASLALGIYAFRRKKVLGGTTGTLIGLLFVALGALSATLSVATRGFQALTREEVAAVLETRPTGERALQAVVHFPDGDQRVFRLRGSRRQTVHGEHPRHRRRDVLGLHTAYELDRIGGRYLELEAERDSARTVFSLAEDRPVQIGRLLERFPFLERVVDAEYGSATYVEVDRPRTLEVRVSTSGLLIRPADTAAAAGG